MKIQQSLNTSETVINDRKVGFLYDCVAVYKNEH